MRLFLEKPISSALLEKREIEFLLHGLSRGWKGKKWVIFAEGGEKEQTPFTGKKNHGPIQPRGRPTLQERGV